MKLLILKSERLLFPKAPNFYGYLAKGVGRFKEWKKLNQEYERKKEKGPLLLKETVKLCLAGRKYKEVERWTRKYIEKYLNPKFPEFIWRAKSKGYLTGVFTSYPQILLVKLNSYLREWRNLQISFIHGAPVEIEVREKWENSKFGELKDLVFRNERFVKRQMAKLGFKENFTYEANRYGLLGKLIELMKDLKLKGKDVVLIGEGPTAKPMMKLAGRVIRKFDPYSLEKIKI